jgi:hypothetical protein
VGVPQLQADVRFRCPVLDSIREKVCQHLFEPLRVALDAQPGVGGGLYPDTARANGHPLDDVAQELTQVEPLEGQLHSTGLEQRRIHQIARHPTQMLRRGMDLLDIVQLLVAEARALQQRTSQGNDTDRLPEIVGDDGGPLFAHPFEFLER